MFSTGSKAKPAGTVHEGTPLFLYFTGGYGTVEFLGFYSNPSSTNHNQASISNNNVSAPTTSYNNP